MASIVAAVWLVTIVTIDAFDGHRLVLTGLFAASPLIASAATSAGRTALYAVAAITCTFVAGWTWDHLRGDPNYIARVLAVTTTSTLAVGVAWIRGRREEQLRRMTLIADAAQRAVLPLVPPVVGDFHFSTRYQSATRDSLIGGDFYEIAGSSGQVRAILGDVRGKGVEAVRLAALVVLAFRRAAATAPTLPAVAEELDRAVRPALEEEDFVTAVLVELSRDRLQLVNCGHEPPLLVSEAGAELLASREPMLPLGLETKFTDVEITWPPGARLLLYTDGLTESRDPRGEFLSIEQVAEALGTGDVEQALDAVVDLARRHSRDRAHDDMALLLIEREARVPNQTLSLAP